MGKGIRLFISGSCGNKEIANNQHRIIMILKSLSIEHELVDVGAPGTETDRDFMREHGKKKEGQRHCLPPQIFNGEKYCGGYDEFDVANEDDELEEFLGLPRKTPKVDPTKTGATEAEVGKLEPGKLDADGNSIVENGAEAPASQEPPEPEPPQEDTPKEPTSPPKEPTPPPKEPTPPPKEPTPPPKEPTPPPKEPTPPPKEPTPPPKEPTPPPKEPTPPPKESTPPPKEPTPPPKEPTPPPKEPTPPPKEPTPPPKEPTPPPKEPTPPLTPKQEGILDEQVHLTEKVLEHNDIVDNEKNELKLEIPPPEVEFFEEEELDNREYMDDGEYMRDEGPGFKDLKNCKRFWKVTNIIGTP